jgi:hypothetical protein
VIRRHARSSQPCRNQTINGKDNRENDSNHVIFGINVSCTTGESFFGYENPIPSLEFLDWIDMTFSNHYIYYYWS